MIICAKCFTQNGATMQEFNQVALPGGITRQCSVCDGIFFVVAEVSPQRLAELIAVRPVGYNKITSLTKENFWNDLRQKYPKEMKRFCAWIDEYKKRVAWKDLFCNAHITMHVTYPNKDKGSHNVVRNIKYHDLPISMQVGIFIQYSMENYGRTGEYIQAIPRTMTKFAEVIRLWFASNEPKNDAT